MVPLNRVGDAACQGSHDFPRTHGLDRFHQYEPTRPGEAGLAAGRLAIQQHQQIVIEHSFPKQVGETGQSLLDADDAADCFFFFRSDSGRYGVRQTKSSGYNEAP